MHCVVEHHEDTGIYGNQVKFSSSENSDPAVERQECRAWIDAEIQENKRIDLDYAILRVVQRLSVKLSTEVVDL